MNKKKLGWDAIRRIAARVATTIEKEISITKAPPLKIYGIPRGGIYAAQAILPFVKDKAHLVEEPDRDCIFIDDVIDTGETRKGYKSKFEPSVGFTLPFYALIDKQGSDIINKDTWIEFPWERMNKETGPAENVRRLIEYIGDDPDREGLRETPDRVVRSYKKLYGGYADEPIIKTFKDDTCNEMIILRDIEFYSTCEHHMLPFYGNAHIAYIPNGMLIGISKIIRILEMYSRRLQIQERLGEQITKALETYLHPHGVACVLEAQHFCMTARGVEKQRTIMVTSSLTGSFKTSIETRNEFLKMIRS